MSDTIGRLEQTLLSSMNLSASSERIIENVENNPLLQQELDNADANKDGKTTISEWREFLDQEVQWRSIDVLVNGNIVTSNVSELQMIIQKADYDKDQKTTLDEMMKYINNVPWETSWMSFVLTYQTIPNMITELDNIGEIFDIKIPESLIDQNEVIKKYTKANVTLMYLLNNELTEIDPKIYAQIDKNGYTEINPEDNSLLFQDLIEIYPKIRPNIGNVELINYLKDILQNINFLDIQFSDNIQDKYSPVYGRKLPFETLLENNSRYDNCWGISTLFLSMAQTTKLSATLHNVEYFEHTSFGEEQTTLRYQHLLPKVKLNNNFYYFDISSYISFNRNEPVSYFSLINDYHVDTLSEIIIQDHQLDFIALYAQYYEDSSKLTYDFAREENQGVYTKDYLNKIGNYTQISFLIDPTNYDEDIFINLYRYIRYGYLIYKFSIIEKEKPIEIDFSDEFRQQFQEIDFPQTINSVEQVIEYLNLCNSKIQELHPSPDYYNSLHNSLIERIIEFEMVYHPNKTLN